GKWIAYWTGIPVWDQVGGAVGASGALAIVPATGGSPRVVAGDMASARYGVWSPDSKRLLFVGERVLNGRNRDDWFTISRDGGEAVETGALDVLGSLGIVGMPIPGGWTAAGVEGFGHPGACRNG